jgi:endo-1,4-beta-mannosidase
VSSDFASADNAATYYRHLLHSTLLAGATGWIAWNNTDFALPQVDPYRHHAFEQNFGLTDASGTPKGTLREMADFAGTLSAIDFGGIGRADTDTALIVPSYLDTQHPFTSPDSSAAVSRALLQSYIAARLADMPPRLTRETTGIEPGARLYAQAAGDEGWTGTRVRTWNAADRRFRVQVGGRPSGCSAGGLPWRRARAGGPR